MTFLVPKGISQKAKLNNFFKWLFEFWVANDDNVQMLTQIIPIAISN